MALAVAPLPDIATIVTMKRMNVIAAVAITTRDIVMIVASNTLGLRLTTVDITTMPIV
jgi:hypothetical protein